MYAVAAGTFRTVHSFISTVRELLRIDIHVLCGIECGNADRNSYALGIGASSPPEMAGEAFRGMPGSIPRRVGHQYRELVASPPRSQIGFPKGCGDGISNAP